MHVEMKHSAEQLAALVRKEKNARVATRLRAVLLAVRGRTHRQIADDLAVGARSVQEWIQRYNTGGVEALRDRPRPGQPKKLLPHEEEQVIQWLERGPDLKRDGLVAWRGPALVEKIHRHFGKKFSLSGGYSLLHRLGYEPLRPRPIHRKADPAAQEEFKRSTPPLSGACGARTRA